MGLDQYAYAVSKRSVAKKELDCDLSERVKRQKLACWRNHWHLCDWIAKLYYKKGGKKGPKKGCSVCLQLHERDLDALERAVQKKVLYGYTWRCPYKGSPNVKCDCPICVEGKPQGSPNHEFDDFCLANDLEFLKKARKAISDGKAVICYNWW